MKTILCLFAIVFVCSQAITISHEHQDDLVGAWETRDPQEFMKDSQNHAIFENAKQQFIAQASQANEISGTQLTVKDVKGVSTQVVAGLNIRFDVNLVDANGKVYDVTLVVWSQPWTKTVKLTEYKINERIEYEL